MAKTIRKKEKHILSSQTPKKTQTSNRIYIGIAVIVIIVIIAVVASFSQSYFPEGISIQPPSKTIRAGDTFTVNVYAKGMENLKGYQFNILYDPDILEVVSVSRDGLFERSGKQIFNVEADTSESGIIKNIAGVVLYKDEAVSGDGELVSINFRAKSPGTSRIALSNVKLIASGNTPIYTDVIDGEVKVI